MAHIDTDVRITGSWDTLINPGRDLGRQDSHRIRAADIMQARDSAHVTPQLIEFLSGSVLVAHNAHFDTSFLLAELRRLA